VDVSATQGWQQTAITLHRGDKVSLWYERGVWSVDHVHFPYVGPGGYSSAVDQQIYQGCKLNPNWVYGLMLGRIGNGPTMVIGQAATLTADRDGPLQLRIHDGDACLGDNDGTVRMEYSVQAPSPPPTRHAAVTGRARCGVTFLPQNQTAWKNAYRVRIQAPNGEARDASVHLGLWATTFSKVPPQGEKANAYVYCAKSDKRPAYGKVIDVKAPATWQDLSFAKQVVMPKLAKNPTAAQVSAWLNAFKAVVNRLLPSVSLPKLPKLPTADQISAWVKNAFKVIADHLVPFIPVRTVPDNPTPAQIDSFVKAIKAIANLVPTKWHDSVIETVCPLLGVLKSQPGSHQTKYANDYKELGCPFK
jgi:hypothetical protein